MKVRVIYKADDSVMVIYPVLKSRRENESEFEWLNRVFDKATPDGADYDDIDLEQMPLPDRRFRTAWKRGKNGIDVDLARAKIQILEELRLTRNAELNETDMLITRASEIGTKSEIEKLKQYRQQLRDLPQIINFDKIKTVDRLQAIYPRKLTIEAYFKLVDI